MPLIVHKEIQPQGQYGIWQTNENNEFFFTSLDLYPEELAEIQPLKFKKKTEWLSSRYLLHLLSGRTMRGACLKDTFGKPYLTDSDHYISISHTLDYTAVIASLFPVGIDIQYIVDKIHRISGKFISDQENMFIPEANNTLYFHAIWGAKESMYKAYGKKELDFKKHMIVKPFIYNPDGFYFEGEIKKGEIFKEYRLFCSQSTNIILVYAVEQ